MRLEEERNEYRDQSTIDELTRLKNRRDFKQTFNRYLNNFRSSDDLLCIVILDIDCFKNYNDFYGHPKGDECLRSLGKAFIELSESENFYAARIGGEEFSMLWFEKDRVEAENIVIKIFDAVNDLEIPHEKTNVANVNHVTVSIGLYVIRCGSSNDMEAIYKFADMALYEAKNNGRNRAVISGEDFKQYKLLNTQTKMVL
jgi:diguanylate cyclase (GGDEF)-like protein